jgi:hypothetical protein
MIFKTPNSIAIPQKYYEFSFKIILALNLPQLTKSFNVQLCDNIFKIFKIPIYNVIFEKCYIYILEITKK